MLPDQREKVYINDVGPRDGLQNQASVLSVEARIKLIEALVDAGVKSIEAGAFVSPKAVPAMAGTEQVLGGVPAGAGVDYQVLIPNLRGYELARAAGASTVLLVICATETMNARNVRLSVDESLQQAAVILRAAQADGIRAIACVAVAWECPFEGRTNPAAVMELSGRLLAFGADQVVIADTIGAANPRAVYKLMADLARDYGASRLACHFHDTRAMGMANAYAALDAGIRHFDSSVGGIGGCPFAPGATGNIATEDLIMMLEQMGLDTGINLPVLMDAGKLAGELLGVETGGRAAAWRRLQREKEEALV
ncbi:hydroxymethylglutaryl-CoA lyase [Biformimicrobium ophioploci]|uniref:Hydroxymethylglutaryl-CoA lyase n=1 Tax=Biformimicrobium ophioploci TaxID=3036711 RepID=A0ABQ6LW60_9GAMM|nr:hydroxymethylglutaryl-CoA lyase [Microbulbifer sp. NKW57]GMG86314.1 hydroxymethylglutaryl-CoA lyase [Microbulbifer sp. NKW57]